VVLKLREKKALRCELIILKTFFWYSEVREGLNSRWYKGMRFILGLILVIVI